MADLFGMEASESAEQLPVPTRKPLVLTAATPRGKHYVEPRGYYGQPGTGPEGTTCRQCAHYVSLQGHAKTFPKCGKNKTRWTHGRGSDILASAPSCRYFEPERVND